MADFKNKHIFAESIRKKKIMGDKKYYVIVNEVHYGPFNLDEIKHHEHLLPNTQILEADSHTFFKASEMNELKEVFAEVSEAAKATVAIETDINEDTTSKDARSIVFSVFKILSILAVLLLLLYMNQASEKPVNHTTKSSSEQEIQPIEEASRLRQMKTEAELKEAKLAQIKLLEKSCLEAEEALQAAQLERKNIDAFKFFRTGKKKAAQLAEVDAKIASIQQEIKQLKAEISQLQSSY